VATRRAEEGWWNGRLGVVVVMVAMVAVARADMVGTGVAVGVAAVEVAASYRDMRVGSVRHSGRGNIRRSGWRKELQSR